jgi:hypothetical protein
MGNLQKSNKSTAPPLTGCLNGPVDYITYSTGELSYGQADTASIGGTALCATCNVKPPLYAEFSIRLERAIERKQSVQACYDKNGNLFQVKLSRLSRKWRKRALPLS